MDRVHLLYFLCHGGGWTGGGGGVVVWLHCLLGRRGCRPQVVVVPVAPCRSRAFAVIAGSCWRLDGGGGMLVP